ncbi:hypothetical protein [Heyndrickxia camelliae]|uniref:Uncharacterized protein n=1 Tax=Heyndrickxia camelliae TaxID=1707093 RepID=A0A2N3LF91_9BACI|nr:hypothetical protein [Heyndrickxia camelliae]PKR83245.1 hypothetical protein CWO92_19775 [Heyndrickxia camelliae]
MMVGNVISKDNQLQVITRVLNDRVIANTLLLEEYISKNIMIKYKGELRTIQEIIDIECENYLSKSNIIEM